MASIKRMEERMLTTARKTVAGVAVLGAAALGGAVISDAATSGSSSSSSSGTATQQQGAPPPQGYGRPGGPPPGRHIGQNGEREKALDAETAAKVKAAAEDKLPGATVERVETDVDTGSPYEAHVRKSDGSEVVVYVNKSFEVTSVASMQHP
jgi:hypothetical protein